MTIYRLYRNIEKSIIDFLIEELEEDGWEGVRVEKSFAKAHDGTLPAICVNLEEPDISRIEIGSNQYEEISTVSIRLFCKDDGFRLDLSSWLLEKIMPGINYYEYTITSGKISGKVLSGKISIQKIISSRKELKNTEGLDEKDKFRHLFQFTCKVN